MVRNRAFSPALVASENISVIKMSSRSRASSDAVASSVRRDATRVASAALPAGAQLRSPLPRRRIVRVLESVRTECDGNSHVNAKTDAPLRAAEAHGRVRGRCAGKDPSANDRGAIDDPVRDGQEGSSFSFAAGETPRIKDDHNLSCARVRVRATCRSGTVAPGNSTLWVISQVVARSNNMPGRSGAGPAQGVKPSIESESGRPIGKVAVASPSRIPLYDPTVVGLYNIQ